MGDPGGTGRGRGRGSPWEKAGTALYRGALGLLPGWLRERAGEAMLATFLERQGERLEGRGAAGLPALWMREVGDLLATAVRARLPGRSAPAGVRRSDPPGRSLHRRGSLVAALA
ncbi:MAG TPA: hypothetical protein VLL48_13145, partial [Longimicrobiales bacterium]|nr:hypothetical protein [Longimicrobiales bacterium]